MEKPNRWLKSLYLRSSGPSRFIRAVAFLSARRTVTDPLIHTSEFPVRQSVSPSILMASCDNKNREIAVPTTVQEFRRRYPQVDIEMVFAEFTRRDNRIVFDCNLFSLLDSLANPHQIRLLHAAETQQGRESWLMSCAVMNNCLYDLFRTLHLTDNPRACQTILASLESQNEVGGLPPLADCPARMKNHQDMKGMFHRKLVLFVKNLVCDGVFMAHLKQDSVLGAVQVENLASVPTNSRRASDLMSMLTRRGPTDIYRFIQVLKKTEQHMLYGVAVDCFLAFMAREHCRPKCIQIPTTSTGISEGARASAENCRGAYARAQAAEEEEHRLRRQETLPLPGITPSAPPSTGISEGARASAENCRGAYVRAQTAEEEEEHRLRRQETLPLPRMTPSAPPSTTVRRTVPGETHFSSSSAPPLPPSERKAHARNEILSRLKGVQDHQFDKNNPEHMSECSICMENHAAVVNVPCGHTCMCAACTVRLLEHEGSVKCPICRGQVQISIPFYPC